MKTLRDRCKVVTSNIVLLEVDAIVNAANTSLLGGGGVDGAIHRAAGTDLEHACRMLNGCKVGEAKLTPGFRLRAGHIIHTVGPVWQDGRRGEPGLLESCYRNSLAIAAERRFGSIAFPAISTGIYRFPKREAAGIAVAEVIRFISQSDFPQTVTFCCFDREMSDIYTGAIEDRVAIEH